ncbi:hypothetical protein PCYB_124040 [Plasmodium cynomolgi strain B]|uniref:Uncharacterized protein n=1 Tax=Plasmodium cynomolgi (strain B) TaxID=1120755 RepID=K6ULM1_PLACD|nr:hypothetical protein PCYB_124040 [Plasmodium cynomolgi strain B]GAB67838.1 hypothetical protein PCYB_124040 [Plasmodium cynomolgi strain B]
MECTPNEEKGTDYFDIITNLFNYFTLGIDDKVTPKQNSPDVQKDGRGSTPHQRNSIQQVVYNLKLKRASDLKISTRFGLDAPPVHDRKGFEKERQQEDNASTNVHPVKCEGGENRRSSSAENCLNGSGERRKKKKKGKKNRDKQYTSSFDFSGGEFFQLKEQSGSEGEEDSKVEKRKEERKKKREKGKEKTKKKKSKRWEEEEEKTKKTAEAAYTANAANAANAADDSELERGMEGTKRNGGCDKRDEGDEPHREEETVNIGENAKGGVCVQEETEKMEKTEKAEKTKKMKKKKTRREEMKVNETSCSENGSAQMKPERRTSEPRNPSNTRKGKHNHVRKGNNSTLSSSFVQPPRSSNSDEPNFLHVVDEAESQRKDFVKAQDELAINYISDSKKSYISIRSSNRDKDDVIQLPKLNLSSRGGRSSSGEEENETTDGEDMLTPLEQLHQ